MKKVRENVKLISLFLLTTLIILVSTQCLRKKTNEVDAITNMHLLAAFVISQSGEKIYGSCDPGSNYCTDCIGYNPMECEFFCNAPSTFSNSPCPTALRVGSCRVVPEIIRYYPPETLGTAQSDCDSKGGKFTAG